MTIPRLPSFARACLLAGCACLLSATLPSPASAQQSKPAVAASDKAAASVVKVEDAWVRATVKGQTASGGYMSLTAPRDLTLIGFTTPAASDPELHEMVMDDSIMRMRAIESLRLPAGRKVALKPGAGGQHLMLMGLKQPLVDGTEIELTLKLRDAAGKVLTQTVKVPVRAQRAAASPGAAPAGQQAHDHGASGHDHHHKH